LRIVFLPEFMASSFYETLVTGVFRNPQRSSNRRNDGSSRTPPSVPEPREGIQLQVLQKRGGLWQIAEFQNTNSLPEVAFPVHEPD